MPPAFVLSQDQTLHHIFWACSLLILLLACVFPFSRKTLWLLVRTLVFYLCVFHLVLFAFQLFNFQWTSPDIFLIGTRCVSNWCVSRDSFYILPRLQLLVNTFFYLFLFFFSRVDRTADDFAILPPLLSLVNTFFPVLIIIFSFFSIILSLEENRPLQYQFFWLFEADIDYKFFSSFLFIVVSFLYKTILWKYPTPDISTYKLHK